MPDDLTRANELRNATKKLTIYGIEPFRASHEKTKQDVLRFIELCPGIHSGLIQFVGRKVLVVLVQEQCERDEYLADLLCEFEVNLTCCPSLHELSISTILIPHVTDEARDDFARSAYF